MRVLGTLAALAMVLPSVAGAASLPQRAAQILATDAPASGPGMAVVVSRDGQILWSGASGKADLAAGQDLSSDSLFRFASITKQFTAALILKMVEDGQLSLDQTLGTLLPAEVPASWHPVTVRQLLNHTSGIPSYTSKVGWMVEAITERPHTTQQLIDVTRDQPLDFAPGSAFRYNNTGYVLLSAIVEKLTGKPWYVALRERITGPLGLSSIRCGCEPGRALAQGYTGSGQPAQKIDMTVPSGAGALVGTAGDLARWAAALHGGKVLKPATYQAMITPSTPEGSPERYAFGVIEGEVRGLATIEHSGGIFGFSTESIYVPSKKLFVAALANADGGLVDPAGTARRLLAEAAGVAYPALVARPLDAKAIEPWLGVYKDGQGERSFFIKDGKLFTQRSGGSPFEAFDAGSGRFFFGPRSLTYFDIARGSDGKPVMTFYPNGAVKGQTATWTGPVPAEPPAPGEGQ